MTPRIKPFPMKRPDGTTEAVPISTDIQDELIRRVIDEPTFEVLDGHQPYLESILRGAKAQGQGSGNATSWEITKDEAVLDDLFLGITDYDASPQVRISTQELLDIILEWDTVKRNYPLDGKPDNR